MKYFFSSLLIALSFSIVFAEPVLPAMDSIQIQKDLLLFEKNPQVFMNRLPRKSDAFTAAGTTPGESIIPHALSPDEVFNARQLDRREIMAHSAQNYEASRERVEDFLDSRELVRTGFSIVRDPRRLDALGLSAAHLPNQPWSSTYWPIYQGMVAARYADPGFMKQGKAWPKYFNYISSDQHSFQNICANRQPNAIEMLSPAEKYDLLIGAPIENGGALTPRMWQEGAYYMRHDGNVEPWMGICHGWAPAATMIARPIHPVTLLAADGSTPIKFYPDDIKGLASLAWAKSKPESKFIGTRCEVKKPKTDANGRITNESCFDINPGDWHLSLVHQIGSASRGMVMDATYDYEVWNQPVYSYQYSYFNPLNKKTSEKAETVAIPIERYKNDKFKKYRSSETAFVVGVVTNVTYTKETQPSHVERDGPSRDYMVTVTYYYDLELDRNFQIIGGEWYQNAHPDFAFVYPPQARPVARYEAQAGGDWSTNQSLPATWQAAAISSASSSEVLYSIVTKLSEMAQ
jgi:hypothetical protein